MPSEMNDVYRNEPPHDDLTQNQAEVDVRSETQVENVGDHCHQRGSSLSHAHDPHFGGHKESDAQLVFRGLQRRVHLREPLVVDK